MVPSEQLRLHSTSFGYDPLEQVITEKIDGGDGGGLGGSGDGGGGSGDGGGGGGWNCTTKDSVPW